jgi:hypothetical protein
MIINDNLTAEYGSRSVQFHDVPPAPFKPSPVSNDYAVGYIYRSFMVKNSDKTGYEINPTTVSQVSKNIYTVAQIVWRISGYANFTKTGNIILDYGISQQNQQQIVDAKINTGVNVAPFLPNLLEFWRGN